MTVSSTANHLLGLLILDLEDEGGGGCVVLDSRVHVHAQHVRRADLPEEAIRLADAAVCPEAFAGVARARAAGDA